MSVSSSRSRGMGSPTVISDTYGLPPVHVLGRGTDALDDLAQGSDVDSIQRSRIEPKDLSRFCFRYVTESLGDPVAGVGGRGLRGGGGGAPHPGCGAGPWWGPGLPR